MKDDLLTVGFEVVSVVSNRDAKKRSEIESKYHVFSIAYDLGPKPP